MEISISGWYTLTRKKVVHFNPQIDSNGTDLMFLKEKKYQAQSEFRFIWTINTKFFDMEKWIDVKCPEAIQYCERHMSQQDGGINSEAAAST